MAAAQKVAMGGERTGVRGGEDQVLAVFYQSGDPRGLILRRFPAGGEAFQFVGDDTPRLWSTYRTLISGHCSSQRRDADDVSIIDPWKPVR
jgi:hypothetical protein